MYAPPFRGQPIVDCLDAAAKSSQGVFAFSLSLVQIRSVLSKDGR